MAKRRRTEVTIHTREVVILRDAASPVRTWCAGCAAQRVFVTPQEAARLAGVSARLIYRCVGENKIHFVETPQGTLLVCGDSLPTAIRSLEGGTRK